MMDEILEEEIIEEISEVESDKDIIDYLILTEKGRTKILIDYHSLGNLGKNLGERKILPLKKGRKEGSKETLPLLSNDRPFLEL
jgi:hypothetical protein